MDLDTSSCNMIVVRIIDASLHFDVLMVAMALI